VGALLLSNELANLFASRFIARKDVKAIQFADGSWMPHTDTGRHDGTRLPWKREHLLAHLEGKQTFGHYLLDQDDTCKLFCFDVDLEKSDPAKNIWQTWVDDEGKTWQMDAREAWRDRSHPARPYMKVQFKEIANKLLRGVYENLGIPCAAAYSGAKGIHVYGFTGLMSAADARDGAEIVLEALGGFTPSKGTNFFTNERWPNLSIEVFPKQTSLAGKDLGNLLRLPLGRNMKTKDPTFFIDMTAPLAELRPVDALWALTTDSPWKRPGE
jgi:hypothetical protein